MPARGDEKSCKQHPSVFIAAIKGAADLIQLGRRYGARLDPSADDKLGLSLSNASLEALGEKHIEEIAKLWGGPQSRAIGIFYSPHFTPSIPSQDYPNNRNTDTATSLLEESVRRGFIPAFAELDVTQTTIKAPKGIPLSDQQLVDTLRAITDIKKFPEIKTIFLWFAPNDGNYGDFANDPKFANQRHAALAAGGIAIDTPAGYWFEQPSAYRATIKTMIRWAARNNVITMFAVSPYGHQKDLAPQFAFDELFAINTRKIYNDLKTSFTLPTMWMVQNYGPPSSTANEPGSEAFPNSLVSVALWLRNQPCQH
jgi:hypothetical protein